MRPCNSMDEVRTEIDRLDRAIVPLLLERLDYIRQAGEIKRDRNTVRDAARVEDVVAKVRAEATSAAKRLNHPEDPAALADYVDEIYRFLIEWSINHEYGVWDRANRNHKDQER
ncbi:chorismate mutase [Yunchengibacter salinarum]|uniref:chorismate mutase n=1 Tax=Yunchengibacter salinarum TaxID=3133399 RepID=UPI0035B69680